MMNRVFLSSGFHTVLNFSENQFIKPLSGIQKKILVIALSIFSLMASGFLIYRCCFQAKHQNQHNVWKGITPSFPSRQTAEEILSENDAFLQVLSSFDRQVRMQSKNPVSHEDFLTFYMKQIQDYSKTDQVLIRQSLRLINKRLKEYGIQLPETIHFIRTTGKEEIPGTAAYCKNQDTIVFNWMNPLLLTHELFHIYSRNHPEMRKKLYALVGYQVMEPLSIPDQLKDKRLVNPDVPYLDAYITVTYQGNKVHAVPIDLYDLNYQGAGKSRFLEGLYHQFALLEVKENGEMEFKLDSSGSPILFDFDEAEDLKDQIGENTSYVDSPEEILADNFALMIMGIQGKSPELIEKMKACFIENR
jgi:hypothetical protein